MSNTLQAHSPEKIEQTTVDSALRAAINAVADIDTNIDFQAYLSDNNKKFNASDDPEYWETMAGFTETYLGSNDILSPLEKESFALVTNLPTALTASFHLKQSGNRFYPEKKADKATACTYNNLIKHYVTSYPQKSEALQGRLLEAALATLGDGSNEFTQNTLGEILKGVRHEIGFTRILDAGGFTYREATVEEDLKGRDIVVTYDGHDIGVDVKASLSEMEARGSENSPYAIKNNGDIIMWSLLLDSQFNGYFEPDSAHIEDMVNSVKPSIEYVFRQAVAKK